MNNKKSKIIFLLMSIIVLIGLFGVQDSRTNAPAKADDIAIVPKSKPTGNSVNLGFLTLISGYGLQPQNQYTYKGQPVTLSVKIDMNPLDYAGSLIIPLYDRQWYSTDKPTSADNWQKVSGGTKNKLTVTPNEVGTVYYQDSYIKKGLLITYNSFYSDVASVTTYPDPIDATSVSVSVDNDYLYNNQSKAVTTFARAKPDPYNSTAKLSWSIDNTNLATIDATTGEITANTSGKSGTATVTATLTNSDNQTVEGSKKIEIGGGLDDQTVDEGQTATFKVLGNWNTVNSITWHHVANGKDTVVSGADGLSYTTPVTTYDNNKDQYYAVLKVPSQDSDGNDTETTVTTNKATLNVNPDLNPHVSSNSTIYNNTYDDHNEANTEINGVIGGDNITVKGTFSDTNKNSIMKSAAIQVKLPDNIRSDPDNQTPDITDVKVDGNAT